MHEVGHLAEDHRTGARAYGGAHATDERARRFYVLEHLPAEDHIALVMRVLVAVLVLDERYLPVLAVEAFPDVARVEPDSTVPAHLRQEQKKIPLAASYLDDVLFIEPVPLDKIGCKGAGIALEDRGEVQRVFVFLRVLHGVRAERRVEDMAAPGAQAELQFPAPSLEGAFTVFPQQVAVDKDFF